MWSYLGSKSKTIKRYPLPVCSTIIEPFAGTARYALLYSDRQVILNDIYKVITDSWSYLVGATPEQIENLPDLKRGDDLRNLNISDVERNLLGFIVARGVSSPRNICSEWSATSKEIDIFKKRVLKNLDKIRHFKIMNVDYRELENVEATWFIDPPYQHGRFPGSRYIHDAIDYVELADWCKSRRGQVIVCENTKANWLDFKPLLELHGQRKRTVELIWTKGGNDASNSRF